LGLTPFEFSVKARVHFGTALKVGRILPETHKFVYEYQHLHLIILLFSYGGNILITSHAVTDRLSDELSSKISQCHKVWCAVIVEGSSNTLACHQDILSV
jgi:hypothetical protein